MRELLSLPVFGDHILSVVVFLPLLGAFILLFLKNESRVRWTALFFAVVDFILAIPLVVGFDRTTHAMQFVERYEWIPSFHIDYYLGVDGISVLFVFLTALIGWVCVLASWTAIEKKVKEFMIALLVIQSAMLGVFSALDFFLFYIFWEAMLIPMYLMIGVWGGPNRVYSAFKFFLYTFAGSILMLVGMIALYFEAGGTFDIPALMARDYAFGFQVFVFALFFIAFAIKVPMFPFHTWLPDAHVEAPTAGSIILAGVLLKMGTYGFLRFSFPMFPDAARFFATPVIILSIIAIIYGAFLALAQDDMKKLVAYSSVSHMGFITLALFLFSKNGIEGGIIQMFNHGITTGALFLCVGIIYERTHTRDLRRYGWAMRYTPFYAGVLFIFTLASVGFPGTNGFIGEILIMLSVYESYKPYVLALVVGIMTGVAYMVWMYLRVSFVGWSGAKWAYGEDVRPRERVWDINLREVVAILAFLALVALVGLQPEGFLAIMHRSVGHLLAQMGRASM
ncbi:MAG: NADH-quinone oxidoreductase subunit M [Deltaproteobacteria bacterium]|nr:NADH-quinone oxidoreductase subunit M [Deltaproteobacteria bacterium]